jgi:hypothetical protein
MSKKKKKSEQKSEEVFYSTVGTEMNPALAYMQAASLLDIAAIVAVQSNDAEGMTVVAHHWMEMAMLMSGRIPDGDGDGPITGTRILGFRDKESRDGAEDAARQS